MVDAADDLERLRDRIEDEARLWGRLVRDRRKALGLSQIQVAELVGCRVQTISKIERGEIVARDYLKAGLALRLAQEINDLFPMPARALLAKGAAA